MNQNIHILFNFFNNELLIIWYLFIFQQLNIPVLPLAVMRSPNKQFNRTKMYNDGSYEKFITEVVLIFAKERQANIDNDQIIADVKNIINLEKELIKVY